MCRQATIDAHVGGQLRMCWPDGCFSGRFVHYAPPSGARFSWRLDGDALPETMVVVSVDPSAHAALRTALKLEHYGFGIGPDWDLQYVGAARAWAAYLKNLRAVLEAGVDLREDDE
ncbi:MAG: SRPBCC family protein [Chloroflexota bacterium]